MSDRELIELAARAADYQIEFGRDDDEIHIKTWKHGNYSKWAPLEDDGDAFRLAVKLRLQVTPGTYNKDKFTAWHPAEGGSCEYLHYGQDELAATRRAIVTTAASVGEKS